MYEYHRTEAERDALVEMLGFLSQYLNYEALWQEELPAREEVNIDADDYALVAADRAHLDTHQANLLREAGVTQYEMNEFMQVLMNNLTRLGEFAEQEVNW